MPTYRIRRHPHTNPTRVQAVTAAGQRLESPNVTSPANRANKIANTSRDDWTTRAWEYKRLVGELDYYVRWRSNAVSRARLVPVAIDPYTLTPTPLPDDDPNALVLAELVRSIGGDQQSQLLKRWCAGLTVPGLTYAALIHDPKTQAERWIALSSKELKKSGDTYEVTLDTGDKHTIDETAGEYVVKMWDPDPEQASEPTSPVRANLPVLNEIVRATATIDQASRSRLMGNGIVLVDDTVNLPKSPAPVADTDPDTPTPAASWDEASADDLMDLVIDVATKALQDPESAAAGLPIFATISSAAVKASEAMHHLKFDSDVPTTALDTRERAIRRLALGLEVSPERLLGMGTSTNHWSLWGIDEQDVKLHVEPILELIANTLTAEVFRPALETVGINPALYGIGYDVTELTQDPDRKAEATTAFNAGAITGRAFRQYVGFADEDAYNLDEVDGWVEWAHDRVAQNPAWLPMLAPILALDPTVTLPAVDPGLAPARTGTSSTPALPAGTTQAEPATEPGGTGAVASLLVTMSVRRALELAGKRLTTRTTRIPSGVAAWSVHEHLPAVPASDVPKLITGWDATLTDDVFTASRVERRAFTRVVEKQVTAILTKAR